MDEALIAERMRGKVLALTGAGMSAASGIPTFRGAGGIYEKVPVEDLATPDGFARDPEFVWRWYLSRLAALEQAEPNAGHHALARLDGLAKRVTVITQNVDDLHERAGQRRLFKLHGRIREARCTLCKHIFPIRAEEQADDIPRCAGCGALARPNVVWFGERPWQDAIDAAIREIPESDIVLNIGQSGNVDYGAADLAHEMGIPVVNINPGSDFPAPGLEIREGVEIALPRLVSLAAG